MLEEMTAIPASLAALLAPVWHFWLAVPLAALTILAVIVALGLYLVKVTKTRYPPHQ